MELLIIIALAFFKKEVKKILKKSGVKVYSQMGVTGYKDQHD